MAVAGLGLWMGAGLALLRVDPQSEAARQRLAAQLTPGERASIRAGRVSFLDGRAAVRLAAAYGGQPPRRGGRSRRELLVVLNTPAVFRSGPDGPRVLDVTRAAVALGARLMVDCTDADLARLTAPGWESLLLAKRAGLWRLVVFDGAHHLPGLAADPELLLLPLLSAGGVSLIVHGYVRDALSLAGLRQVMRSAGRSPVLLTLPRVSLPLKETLPLEFVVRRALRLVDEGGEEVPGGPDRGRQTDSPGEAALRGVVRGEAAARLPNGVVLAARREGDLLSVARLVPGARGPVTAAWVGVSHGTFTLRRPPAPPLPRRRAGAAGGDPGKTGLVQLGWPVSVWDLLLRYPTALVGAPLPWSPPRRRGLSGQS